MHASAKVQALKLHALTCAAIQRMKSDALRDGIEIFILFECSSFQTGYFLSKLINQLPASSCERRQDVRCVHPHLSVGGW